MTDSRLRSMTGYGTATLEHEGTQVTVEVKCLNSKFLEVFLKLPRELNDRETEIRTTITQALERGKVSMVVEIQRPVAQSSRGINQAMFQHWYGQLLQAADSVAGSREGLVKAALAMPDVLTSASTEDETTPDLAPTLALAVQQALLNCNQFRQDEGQVLANKVLEYVAEIRTHLLTIEAHDPARLQATRQRLYDRLTELGDKVQIDNNRFEQELIYYLEKLDVSEEKVRLRSHLDYFEQAVQEGSGKKLGFIAQEMGREINTIGSKINDAQIQRTVVDMKDLLEKIKEQSLNVL